MEGVVVEALGVVRRILGGGEGDSWGGGVRVGVGGCGGADW